MSSSEREIFRQIRYEYFRDSTVALEASRAIRWIGAFENSAKNWATSYDFPAVREKRVVREEFPDPRTSAVMQAFAFNIRRDKFKDPRVRRAFNFAFDFEEMNRQLFFGPVQTHRELFRGHRACGYGYFRKAKSWRFWKHSATRYRPICSPSPTPTRSEAIRRQCATICAMRSLCFATPV